MAYAEDLLQLALDIAKLRQNDAHQPSLRRALSTAYYALFRQAQHNRNEADYNLVRKWEPAEVSLLIEEVADAFNRWNIIRGEEAARDYLISMLPSREKKQPEKARQDRRPG